MPVESPGHVYVARLLTDDAMADVAALGRPMLTGPERPPSAEELRRDAAGAAALVCTLTERIDAALLEAAGPQLRIVATASVGYALREGRLRGAALDVLEGEPVVDPRLLELDQVVLTPHLGSAGDATRSAMCRLAVRNVAAVLAGRPPLTPVEG